MTAPGNADYRGTGPTRQEAIDTVTEEAIRGFFFEKHLPFHAADEWTDEVMAIVKEHRG